MKTNIKLFKLIFLLFAIAGSVLFYSCGSDDPEPSCADGIKNGTEVGVDCGGDCPPCFSCADGILNGNETGIDCGGDCIPCPTCVDGVQNGNETEVDCGGDCPPCPTCSDGVQNGDEEGIDCGGTECPPCYGVGTLGEAGGVIFFDKGSYSNGWRFLEAASIDMDCNGGPGCDLQNASGTSQDVGSGEMNSETLLTLCNWDIQVSNYSQGGFDDWFIPSEDELSALRINRDLVPNLEEGGECKSYWSSTLTQIPGQTRFSLRCLNFGSNEWFFTNPGQIIRPIRQF